MINNVINRPPPAAAVNPAAPVVNPVKPNAAPGARTVPAQAPAAQAQISQPAVQAGTGPALPAAVVQKATLIQQGKAPVPPSASINPAAKAGLRSWAGRATPGRARGWRTGSARYAATGHDSAFHSPGGDRATARDGSGARPACAGRDSDEQAASQDQRFTGTRCQGRPVGTSRVDTKTCRDRSGNGASIRCSTVAGRRAGRCCACYSRASGCTKTRHCNSATEAANSAASPKAGTVTPNRPNGCRASTRVSTADCPGRKVRASATTRGTRRKVSGSSAACSTAAADSSASKTCTAAATRRPASAIAANGSAAIAPRGSAATAGRTASGSSAAAKAGSHGPSGAAAASHRACGKEVPAERSEVLRRTEDNQCRITEVHFCGAPLGQTARFHVGGATNRMAGISRPDRDRMVAPSESHPYIFLCPMIINGHGRVRVRLRRPCAPDRAIVGGNDAQHQA